MSTATEHYLEAERILRNVTNLFADDPAVAHGLALATLHAQLAQVALVLDGAPADGLTNAAADAIAEVALVDGILRGHIDPSGQHL